MRDAGRWRGLLSIPLPAAVDSWLLQLASRIAAMKPIDTKAYGRLFRSRLEARWAVAFTAMGMPWEYEPEGFVLNGPWYTGPYLPDFWLESVQMWAEVKAQPFTEEEMLKCQQLAHDSGHPCLLLNGPPRHVNFWATMPPGQGWYFNYWSTIKECADGFGQEFMQGEIMDYDLFYFYLNADRLYMNTGTEYSCELPLVQKPTGGPYCANLPDPVDVAMSARFEHGQSPR